MKKFDFVDVCLSHTSHIPWVHSVRTS